MFPSLMLLSWLQYEYWCVCIKEIVSLEIPCEICFLSANIDVWWSCLPRRSPRSKVNQGHIHKSPPPPPTHTHTPILHAEGVPPTFTSVTVSRSDYGGRLE